MSKKKRRLQVQRRVAFCRTWPNGIPRSKCPACGDTGPHYCPPSLSDDGFYMCTEHLRDGRAVNNETGEPARRWQPTDQQMLDFMVEFVPPPPGLQWAGPDYMDDM